MPALAARISHTAWGLDSGPTGDWRAGHPCAHYPDGWYPEDRSPTRKQRREQTAVAWCHRCEVEARCLAWALEHGERHGVWGGTTEEQRAPMLADRAPQRRMYVRGRAEHPTRDPRRYCPTCHRRVPVDGGRLREHDQPRGGLCPASGRVYVDKAKSSTGEESA